MAQSEVTAQLKLANEEWARALAQQDRAALDRIMAEDFVLAYPFTIHTEVIYAISCQSEHTS